MKVGFVMESLNMARIFSLVAPHLSSRGASTVALCSDARASTREGRAYCAEKDWAIADLPHLGNLDVRLPELVVRMLEARRRVRPAISRDAYDCLVVGNDIGPVSSHVVDAAIRSGIPTVLVQDGLRPRQRRQRAASTSAQIRYYLKRRIVSWPARVPTYGGRGVTAIAAMGNQLTAELAERGVPTDTVTVAGAPAYDYLGTSLAAGARPAPVGSGEVTILFAHQDLDGARPDEMVASSRAVIEEVCVGASLNLVFKLHPSSRMDPDDVRRLVPEAGDRLVVPSKRDPIAGMIEDADVVVTVYSTVAIEAVYCGLPVVFADLCPCSFYLAGPEDGPSLGWVGDASDLAPMVERAARDVPFRQALWRRQRQMMEFYTLPPDGRAAERVAELIWTTAARVRSPGASPDHS